MIDKQQPYHPYVLIRQNMDTYYNKLDAMNKKILITVTHIKNMENYHEYKLAVKTFALSDNELDTALCDDGDIISLYNDRTLSQKSRSMRKLLQFRNKRKRQKNKLLLERQISLESITSPKINIPNICTGDITRSFYEIKENKLLNEMILFEWILKRISKLTRIITYVLIIIGFVFTTMSIVLYIPDQRETISHKLVIRITSKSWSTKDM
eukprot:249472_1